MTLRCRMGSLRFLLAMIEHATRRVPTALSSGPLYPDRSPPPTSPPIVGSPPAVTRADTRIATYVRYTPIAGKTSS